MDKIPRLTAQMQHPNVITDAWATKSPCEQILFEHVLTFFDVLELTALAGANRYFHQMQWPRSAILYDFDSRPLDLESLDSKLERLGERLRSAASEEERCRTAWALTVLLNSCYLGEWGDGGKLARMLASALVIPAPWASMSTACAIAQLLRCSDTTLNNLLAEVGVTEVLVQLVQHTSAPVQQVALKAIAYAANAGICLEVGDSLISRLATDLIPTIISIARWGAYPNQPEAVKAIEALAAGSGDDQLKVVIPDVLEFLVHERAEMKKAAATALVHLMLIGEDFVIKACEHGCLPKLVDGCWRSTGFHQEMLLMCLELITMREACQQMAVQHGILELLFQRLQDGNVMMERDRQRRIFYMLLAVPTDARTAFLQESQRRRASAIRHMTWIARQRGNPNSASAEELLELLG